MATTTQLPLKVLVVGQVREFPPRDGRPATKMRTLQCFTGDVVGEIPFYIREGVADIDQPGDFNATIEWGNYQGRLTPRVVGLAPRKNVGEAAQK